MTGPVCYAVVAPRSGELVAWLRCNDVDPAEVPYSSPVFIESADGAKWVIRHDVYVRTAAGALTYDRVAETFELAERAVPLLNDPPMGWLVLQSEAAPDGVGAACGCPTTADFLASEDSVSDGAHNCD